MITAKTITYDELLKLNPTGWVGVVDTNPTDNILVKGIKRFQKQITNENVYDENRHTIARACDFNHAFILFDSDFDNVITYKKNWIGKKKYKVKVVGNQERKIRVSEEVNYPESKIQASNIITSLEHYREGLINGHYNNVILCKPLMYINPNYINEIIRKHTGKVTYDHSDLIDFALVFCGIKKEVGKNDTNTTATCSQWGASVLKKHCEYLRSFMNDTRLDNYAKSKFYNPEEIAPIHFLLGGEFFEYFILKV